MSMPERVEVLIAIHNRREKTLDCLTHLYRQQMPNNYLLEVYLVDDGSTDGTADAVNVCFPEVTIIGGTGALFLEPRNVYCVE